MAEQGAGAGPAAGAPSSAPGGAPAQPGAAPAGRGYWTAWVVRAFRPVVSAQTWLGLSHLLAGVLTGAVVFPFVVACTTLGIGLLWLFLAGVPVLVAALWMGTLFARAERARFEVTLGARIPAPPLDLGRGPGWGQRLRRLLTARATQRQFWYAVLRLPLGVAETGVAVAVWSFGLAMFGLPYFAWLVLHFEWHIGGYPLGHPWELVAAPVAGLAVLLAAPHVTRGLVAMDTAIARYLIGPGGNEDMSVRIGELERSRSRVVDAAEAERRRIERDLHDGAQQRLVSIAMDLARARARWDDDPGGAKGIVDQAYEDAKRALTELRNLVRGVHPPVLTDRGLDAAISGLAAMSPVPVSVRVRLDARPQATVEAIAYFVVAEALTNVAKHARASRAEVTVGRRGDVLRVVIRDDGVGGADPRGQGLTGLADRAAGVDGRLTVRSPAGGPTVIEVDLPCNP
jgi:signal transduction histidine kinase